MSTLTPRSTRTISGYVSNLLEYPRWYMERDIDFSSCEFHGIYHEEAKRCTTCAVGAGCRWLNRERSPTTNEASLPELIEALDAAVSYVGEHCGHDRHCTCATCSWIHEARALLRSRSHWT